jgi:hypothetical protein
MSFQYPQQKVIKLTKNYFLSFIEKQSITLLQLKKANHIDEYEMHLKHCIETSIGRKIDELIAISETLEKERNELATMRIVHCAHNNQVDEKLLEREELLNVQLVILDGVKALKREYYRQAIYPLDRNIVEHPLFNASTPKNKRLQQHWNKNNEINLHKEGFRRLFYSNKNGVLLTTYDLKVFTGLLKLWELKGRRSKIVFKISEMLDVLNEPKSGGLYQTVESSLVNLKQTSIIMDEFTDPGTGERQHKKAFSPFQFCDIDRNSKTVVVELSLPIQESMTSNNIINISMILLNDLNPVARVLYITLTNFVSWGKFSVNFRKLIQHIGLQDINSSRSVRTVIHSLQELKNVGFLESFGVMKIRKGHEILHFTQNDWNNHTGTSSN